MISKMKITKKAYVPPKEERGLGPFGKRWKTSLMPPDFNMLQSCANISLHFGLFLLSSFLDTLIYGGPKGDYGPFGSLVRTRLASQGRLSLNY